MDFKQNDVSSEPSSFDPDEEELIERLKQFQQTKGEEWMRDLFNKYSRSNSSALPEPASSHRMVPQLDIVTDGTESFLKNVGVEDGAEHCAPCPEDNVDGAVTNCHEMCTLCTCGESHSNEHDDHHRKVKRSKKKKKKKSDNRPQYSTDPKCFVALERLSEIDFKKHGIRWPEDESQDIPPRKGFPPPRLEADTPTCLEEEKSPSDPDGRPTEMKGTAPTDSSPRKRPRRGSPLKSSTELSKENMPPSLRINLSRIGLPSASVGKLAETEDDNRLILHDKVESLSCESETNSRVDSAAISERTDSVREGLGLPKSKPGPSVIGATTNELDRKVQEKQGSVAPKRNSKWRKSDSSNGKTSVPAKVEEHGLALSSTTKDTRSAVSKDVKEAEGIAEKSSRSVNVRDSEASQKEMKDSESGRSEVTDSESGRNEFEVSETSRRDARDSETGRKETEDLKSSGIEVRDTENSQRNIKEHLSSKTGRGSRNEKPGPASRKRIKVSGSEPSEVRDSGSGRKEVEDSETSRKEAKDSGSGRCEVKDPETSRKETEDLKGSGIEVKDSENGQRIIKEELSSKRVSGSSSEKPGPASRKVDRKTAITGLREESTDCYPKKGQKREKGGKGKTVKRSVLSNILPLPPGKKKPTDVNRNTYNNNSAAVDIFRQDPPKHIKIKKKAKEEKMGETVSSPQQGRSFYLVSTNEKNNGTQGSNESLTMPVVRPDVTEATPSTMEGVHDIENIDSALKFRKESERKSSTLTALLEDTLTVKTDAPPIPTLSADDKSNATIGVIYSKARPKSKKQNPKITSLSNVEPNDSADALRLDVPSSQETNLRPDMNVAQSVEDFAKKKQTSENRITLPRTSKQNPTEPKTIVHPKRLYPGEEERLSTDVENSKQVRKPSGSDNADGVYHGSQGTENLTGSLGSSERPTLPPATSSSSLVASVASSSSLMAPPAAKSSVGSVPPSVASSSSSFMPPPSADFKIPKAAATARSASSSSRNQSQRSSIKTFCCPFTSEKQDFYSNDYFEPNDELDFEYDPDAGDDLDAISILFDPKTDSFFKHVLGEEDKNRDSNEDGYSDESEGQCLSPLSARMEEVEEELEIPVEGEDLDKENLDSEDVDYEDFDNEESLSEGESEDEPEKDVLVQQNLSEGEIPDETQSTTMEVEEGGEELKGAVETDSGAVPAESVGSSARTEGSGRVRPSVLNAETLIKRKQFLCDDETRSSQPPPKRLCTPSPAKLPQTSTKDREAGTHTWSAQSERNSEPRHGKETPSKRATVSTQDAKTLNPRLGLTTLSESVSKSTEDAQIVSPGFGVTTSSRSVTKSTVDAQTVSPRFGVTTSSKSVTKSTEDAQTVSPGFGVTTSSRSVTKSTVDAQTVSPGFGVARSVTKSTKDAQTVSPGFGVTTSSRSFTKSTEDAQIVSSGLEATTPSRSVTKSTLDAAAVCTVSSKSGTKSPQNEIGNEFPPERTWETGHNLNQESQIPTPGQSYAVCPIKATLGSSTTKRVLNLEDPEVQVERAEGERSVSGRSSGAGSIERSGTCVQEWVVSNKYLELRKQLDKAPYEQRQISLTLNQTPVKSNVSIDSTHALVHDPSGRARTPFKGSNLSASMLVSSSSLLPAPLMVLDEQEPRDQDCIRRDASTIRSHPILRKYCAKYLEDGRGNGYSCECREFDGLHTMLPFSHKKMKRRWTPADHEQVWDLFLWSMNFDYWFKKELDEFINFFRSCSLIVGIDYLKKMAYELWKGNKLRDENEEHWQNLILRLRHLLNVKHISVPVDQILDFILSKHPRNEQTAEKLSSLLKIVSARFFAVPKWILVKNTVSKFGLPTEIVSCVLRDCLRNPGKKNPSFLLEFARWLAQEGDPSSLPLNETRTLINAVRAMNCNRLASELEDRVKQPGNPRRSWRKDSGDSRSVTPYQSSNAWMFPSTQSLNDEDNVMAGPSYSSAAYVRPVSFRIRCSSESVNSPPSAHERPLARRMSSGSASGLTSVDDRWAAIQQERRLSDSNSELSAELRLVSPMGSASSEVNIRTQERGVTVTDNSQLDRPVSTQRFGSLEASAFPADNGQASVEEIDFSRVKRPSSARELSVTGRVKEGRGPYARARKADVPKPKRNSISKETGVGVTSQPNGRDLESLIMKDKFGILASRIIDNQFLGQAGVPHEEIRARLEDGIAKRIETGSRTNVDYLKVAKGLLLAFCAKESGDGNPLINYPPVLNVMRRLIGKTFWKFIETRDRENACDLYVCAQQKNVDCDFHFFNEKHKFLIVLELTGLHNHEVAARFVLDNMQIIYSREFRLSTEKEQIRPTTEEEFNGELYSVICRLKDIFRDSLVVDSSIEILKQIGVDSCLEAKREIATLLWNELSGHVDLFILMLLMRKSNEQAYSLYTWAKQKNISLNQNTARCLMYLLTDRSARECLVSLEKEYASARADIIANKQVFFYKNYWTEEEIQFCFEYYLRRFFDELDKTPSSGIRLMLETCELPMPNDEEREFSVNWDHMASDNIRAKVLSMLTTKFNPPFEVKDFRHGSAIFIPPDQIDKRRDVNQQERASSFNHQRIPSNNTECRSPRQQPPNPVNMTTTPQLVASANANASMSDKTVYSSVSGRRPSQDRRTPQVQLLRTEVRAPSYTSNWSLHSECTGSDQQDRNGSPCLNLEFQRSLSLNSSTSRGPLEMGVSPSNRSRNSSNFPQHFTTSPHFSQEAGGQFRLEVRSSVDRRLGPEADSRFMTETSSNWNGDFGANPQARMNLTGNHWKHDQVLFHRRFPGHDRESGGQERGFAARGGRHHFSRRGHWSDCNF